MRTVVRAHARHAYEGAFAAPFVRHALQGELELLGVGVLKAPPRDDVGVVHDHVGMWDAPGVVVVVDDGHLIVAACACRRASGAASRAEERER